MSGASARPARLRPLQFVPRETAGAHSVLVLDPLGLARNLEGEEDGIERVAQRASVVLRANTWKIAQHFDGARTLAEIAELASTGEKAPWTVAEVERVAFACSRRLMLDDERFAEAAQRELEAFRSAPERPFVGAGRDYDADPFNLRIRIAGLVANDWDMPPPHDPVAVITPAASFMHAGALYARTYAALRHSGASFARVLVLGQLRAHLGSSHARNGVVAQAQSGVAVHTPDGDQRDRADQLLIPLDKPFATPLGPLACDEAGVRALAIERSTNELAHRDALVIERQALFLKLLFPKLAIVPVLVAMPRAIDSSPSPDIEHALAALQRVLALPGKTLIVCAVDWSESIGAPLGPAAAARAREIDRACIDHATQADAQAFWFELARAGDVERACALVAPYLLLRLCAGMRRSIPPEPQDELGESSSADERVAGNVLGYLQVNTPERWASAASVLYR